jgi:two-component system NtrC family sensor kinase
MAGESSGSTITASSRKTPSAERYGDLWRKTTLRLIGLYLSPLILLAAYFYLQHDAMVAESERLHLKAIGESQANTLDLFLSERQVNLSNLMDNPAYDFLDPTTMEAGLQELRRMSDAFVDLGFFDSAGVQIAYAGPYPALEKRSYRNEEWYTTLRGQTENHIITDIYLGFRKKPHFTIAVSRNMNGQFVVLRSTLDPERIYDYISSLEGAQEVITSLVNRKGTYQLVKETIGESLGTSPFVPPHSPRQGIRTEKVNGSSLTYAYAWLREVNWALIVQKSAGQEPPFFSGLRARILSVAFGLIMIGFLVILKRARKQVELRVESETTRAQLEHASKLASVGELAAGIAHEINNPLAAISEEAGLMKDLMDPSLGTPVPPQELAYHLDSIQESVFRCRDITRKLLGFVRRAELSLKEHDIHQLLDEVVEGLLGQAMRVSNIEIVTEYAKDIPTMMTDGNQLEQVFLNIIKNAVDALEGKPGRITVRTALLEGLVSISIADTGKGMSPDQMERIFMPFYTTKEVGKGTGLGLSVSYSIIKSLGGQIKIESALGKGSTFTIELPLHPPR